MDDSQRRALRDVGLFAGLDDNAIKTILAAGLERRLPADCVLLRQGDAPLAIFLMVSGRVKMTTVDPQGKQKTLRFMEVGDLIGCAAVFGRFPYPATATAVSESLVLSWNPENFDMLMGRYPAIATRALGVVGVRAENMLRRLHEATTEQVDQRIARTIIRLHEERRASLSVGDKGELQFTREELAELSDTTLFSVSRSIAAWHRAGIVVAGRGRLRILDMPQLSAIADQLAAPVSGIGKRG